MLKVLAKIFTGFLVFSLLFVSLGLSLDKNMVLSIREELEKMRFDNFDLAEARLYFERVKYIEPEGIMIIGRLSGLSWSGDYEVITQKDLNSFFASLWRLFGTTKFPSDLKINFFIQVGKSGSLIVKFPIGALYNLYKEKISRADFLKQCEIWIDGEKATVEGDTIKALGEEFRMNFEL